MAVFRFPTLLCRRSLQTVTQAPTTISLIKEIRHRIPGVSLVLAKRALLASHQDVDAASEWLRQHMKAVAPRQGDLKQGWIGLTRTESGEACMVEVNAETDFVARTPVFMDMVRDLGQCVLTQKPTDERLRLASAQLGESLVLRRSCVFRDPNVGMYVHSADPQFRNMGLGRIGALVTLDTPSDLADRVAQWIVAYHPASIPQLLTNPASFHGPETHTIGDLLSGTRILRFQRFEVGREASEYPKVRVE